MSTNPQLSSNAALNESLDLPARPASEADLNALRQRTEAAAARFQTRNINDYVTIVNVGSWENLPQVAQQFLFENGPTQYRHEAKNGRLYSYNTTQQMWNEEGKLEQRYLRIPELFNQGGNTPSAEAFNSRGAEDIDPYTELLYSLAQVDTDFQVNDLSDPGVRLFREHAVAKLVAFENFADIAKTFGLNLPEGAIPVFGGKQMADGGYIHSTFQTGLGSLAGPQDPNRFLLPITGYKVPNGDGSYSEARSFEDGSQIFLGKNGQPLARLSAADSQAILNPLGTYNLLRKKEATDTLLTQRGAPAGSIPIIAGRENLDPSNIFSAEQRQMMAQDRKTNDSFFPVVRRDISEDVGGLFAKAKAQYGARGAGDYVVVHGYRTADGREVMFEDGPQIANVPYQATALGTDNSPITRNMPQIRDYMTNYVYNNRSNAVSPSQYIQQNYIDSNGTGPQNGAQLPTGSIREQLTNILSGNLSDRESLIQVLEVLLQVLRGQTNYGSTTPQNSNLDLNSLLFGNSRPTNGSTQSTSSFYSTPTSTQSGNSNSAASSNSTSTSTGAQSANTLNTSAPLTMAMPGNFQTKFGTLVQGSGGNSNIYKRSGAGEDPSYYFDPKEGWKSISLAEYRTKSDEWFFNLANPSEYGEQAGQIYGVYGTLLNSPKTPGAPTEFLDRAGTKPVMLGSYSGRWTPSQEQIDWWTNYLGQPAKPGLGGTSDGLSWWNSEALKMSNA